MSQSKFIRIPKEPARLVNDLKAQLYLLRQSLLNSFTEPIYYKEVANKLRLLIYEKPGSKNYNPLLFILADKYDVKYLVSLKVPYPSQGYPFATPGKGEVEFRDYLQIPVFGRGNEQINASKLILDVATQMGGAHEDLTITEYLKPASVQVKGLPYHLEVIQKVSIYSLRYGDLVLEKALNDFGRGIIQEDIDEEVLAPNIVCPSCNKTLLYGQFVCDKCNYSYIPTFKQFTLQEQFEKLFKSSEKVLLQDGLLNGWFSIPELFDINNNHRIIFEITEENYIYSLIRDENNFLVFTRNDNALSKSVKINLNEVIPSEWIYLALLWSNKLLGLHLGSGGNLHSDEIRF